MVKHKASPKKGKNAGFAARIEPPVNDSTTDSTETSEPPPVTAKPNPASRSLASNLTKNAPKAKPKTRVLKEIKRLQTSTNLLIPRAPFLRLVSKVFFLNFN